MNSHPRAIKFMLGAWVLMLCMMISLPSQAQVAGATLSGTITDSSGGVVPNAKISVRNVATGQLKETETNSSGAYTAPNLIPGDYEVSVSARGFSTAVTMVTLTVGAKQEMNIPLAIGQIQQTVEVTGVVPQVELESSTLSGNVQSAEIRQLPLNGRDWASLATLEPGVTLVRTHLDVAHVGGAGGRGFGTQLTVSGGRPTQNSYRLDGAIMNDYSNSGPGSVLGANLGVDAIQEFSVLTSNYSAEYGFTSGGVINAATRSGANAFHGSAFDFVRNDKFDARDFFTNTKGLPKNDLRQNQFGASGGWRILKDKAFLFGAYEGVRKVAGLPVTGNITISDAVRNGTVTNSTTGATISVPIDANIQKFLALYPHPAAGATGCVPLAKGTFNPGGCDPNTGQFNFLGTQRATENFFTARGDHKLSSKDSIFATYLRDASIFSSPLAFNNVSQSASSYRQAIVAEETHVFSPAWANSLRVAEDRTVNFGGNAPTAINPAAGDLSLGMNTPGTTSGFFAPGITITGSGVTAIGGGLGAGPSIQDFWGQIFQVYDDAFATHGTHGFKFGFAFLAVQGNAYTPLNIYNGSGTFSYVGTFPVLSGNPRTPTTAEAPCLLAGKAASDGNNYDQPCGSLINFLTDQPLSAVRPFDASGINKQYLRTKVFGGYVQDDWRFRPSLTLNLGLRYEMSTIPTEIHGEAAIMPSPYTPLPCVSPPLCATTDPTSALRYSFWTHNPTLKNFEPRIGFAWDPFHNGKTAVRGGFGIFDALPLPYEMSLSNTQAAPWRSTLAVPGNATQNVLVSPPKGTWPFGVPAQVGNIHVKDPGSRTFYYVDKNIKRNYVYQYNLNIQRQITSSTTILVGYTGSHGLHNPFQASLNTVFPCGVNPCAPGQGPTLIPGLGYVWPVVWTGSLSAAAQKARLLNPTMGAAGSNSAWQSRSWYNALQVKIAKKMSHGFQIQGSFTFSKTMDDASGSIKGDTFQLGATGGQPWYDLSLDKGLSEFDVRRNLVINGMWQPPTPKSLGALGERVLGGWQLGLITTVGDGVPISPAIAGDLLGEGITTGLEPPNVVAGCSPHNLVNPDYRHSLLYVNTKCLSLVPQTAANLPYCDTTRVGAGFPGFCPNIRGNLGRNTVIGPGLFTADFSVFKNNYIRRISETFNVQVRAEFFNLLNRTNFAPSGAPAIADTVLAGNGLVNPLYSQLTSTQVPNRQIQLALKLGW